MFAPLALSAVLRVGPGADYARIEDALAVAQAGDRIEVAAGEYPRTAVRVRVPRLTLVARGKVRLDGAGFDYSGAGATPRAVVQVEADDATIVGFEIVGAHNRTHNGAAVRIDAARRATIRDCDLHGNDMGVMSNGRSGDAKAAEGQTIERCHVHHNGDPGDPGQNHNLYLGGADVTLRFCEIDHATTGHDLKSRAHLTRVEYCWLHDAANREMDFVESWDTERAGSDAIVVGCVVQKAPQGAGNRGVVHFGREQGRRTGTLRLVNDTIESPFSTPVVTLSGEGVAAEAVNCVVHAATLGPASVRTDGTAPAFRWIGGGRWERTRTAFVGAG